MKESLSIEIVSQFLNQLEALSFEGEIDDSESARLVHSVDNSIYQIKPITVLYPKNSQDIGYITSLLAKPEFHSVQVTAKGGGTGTNGQSLNNGITIDLSRHMNEIISFNVEKREVVVQTGVIKDQLNAFLKPYGFFFAPELSTSNRATIGGMINTDASGQGSYTYGKTRHHVRALKGFLANGKMIDTEQKSPLSAEIYNIIEPKTDLMARCYPALNRSITGYDAKNFHEDETHNLKHLLCGAEGTLGILTEARLNVLPIPKYSALVILSYDDFIEALRHSSYLMKSPVTPTSIEILDDRVVERARNDFVWEVNKHHFHGIDYDKLKAILLVEFNSDDESELDNNITRFTEYMEASRYTAFLSSNVVKNSAISDVYGLRKRAVGLLGNIRGERRTMAFVEDCAVPPEQLADFIIEFKAILDEEELIYGMFGHVDAGVLHVRPALDLKTVEDRERIRKISDQVYNLCVKYKGVLWGEHGKGIRSEYCEDYFGDFYPVLRQIKTLFDPYNQMNKGKIASPIDHETTLYKVDITPMRGEMDQLITTEMWNEYRRINFCNGNGACFNYDLHAPMCPSYKATQDKVQSPKGRAVVLKEWEIRRCTDNNSPEFEEEIFIALSSCLSCGSCVYECPVMINIPNARSQFLEEYYKTRKRSLVHFILAQSEARAPMIYNMRKISNPLFKLPITQSIMKKVGLVDIAMPLDNGLPKLIQDQKVIEWSRADVEHLTIDELAEPAKSVILIPDALSHYYDESVLKDTIELLYKIGLTVYVAPYQNSGKAYHVLGMRDQYNASAQKQQDLLIKLSKLNIPMIGIEPPITVMYRKDYAVQFKERANVQLLQEFLKTYLEDNKSALSNGNYEKYYLLSHCTEKTAVPQAPALWKEIFNLFNLSLDIIPTGCCGMSGAFGHLADQKELSQTIFEQSWQVQINGIEKQENIMATGFSCRTQVKRFSDLTVKHPISVLKKILV